MLKKILIALVVIITALPLNSFAQEEEKDVIRKIILDFNQDIELLEEEGSSRAEKLISYTSPKLMFQRKTINFMNLIISETVNREKISFALKQMKISGVESKRNVKPINDLFIRENLAIARYEVEYELYESDRLINRGFQYSEIIFRKNSNEKWKIEFYTVLNIDDKTYKNMCICEIYEAEGLKSIITTTIVPDGLQVDILEDKFIIDESTEPRQVRHGFHDYQWSTGGAIYKRNIDGSQGRQIGVAKSRQELLLTLLKKEIYPDRCTNVIRKLK